MAEKICILGIAGNCGRVHSTGASPKRSAWRRSPPQVEVFELHVIPLFNEAEEQPLPTRVLELKQRIRQQLENPATHAQFDFGRG